MSEFVHHDVVAGNRICEKGPRVDRPGLVLQGESHALQFVDDAAGRGERVTTERPGQEVDDLRLPGE